MRADEGNRRPIKRVSILDRIDFHIDRNLYCERRLLTNEASVEGLFVERLLTDLGFKDQHIKRKASLDSLTIAKGSKKIRYKPDYCVTLKRAPRLVIDAKAPTEDITRWVEQCAHYCLILNRSRRTIDYFLLTNGLKTALYSWDQGVPVLELDFADFYLGNHKYEKLRTIIALPELSQGKATDELERHVSLEKINKEDAQKLFLNCHKYIWSTEKRGPLSAFTEFVKLIFLKLWNDRILHETYPCEPGRDLYVPVSANTFSTKWILSREGELPNPVNDIQFKKLLEHIQDDIDKNKKKRIFDSDESIRLKPTTIKGVVGKLERVDLFGIDEDLNGRLFETFLNSTMRGEALGQYFTPRSIVLLGTLIADLQVSRKHIDKVLDASCGTGGFLIEAMSTMRNSVRENNSFSKNEQAELINQISNECIYGIDAAAEPNLARIARINMYLHGDGGSHIYFSDGLQKTIQIDKADPRELQAEIEDMRSNLRPNYFDVVLTNPPFSMWYELENEAQAEVLREYDLLKMSGTAKQRNRLRGSAMFVERYEGLLKPGGRLISIIDDTVLSAEQYSYVRDFIRRQFLVRAVISLHGDAFQMAKARVKTALIYLEKKRNVADHQPAAFMYFSTRLGIDDMPVTTNPEKVRQARALAKEEIQEILGEFQKFIRGEKGHWLVQPERLLDRLDCTSCIPLRGRYVPKWKERGYSVMPVSSICRPREEILVPSDHPNEEFRILTISYTGRCRAEEIRRGEHINYSKMKVLRKGDLVFSDYNTFNGAIGYVTDEFDGALASGSYAVATCDNEAEALYLWAILRTTEIRADLLTSAIGMGRQTIDWNDIKDVEVPFPSTEERQRIATSILRAWEDEKKAQTALEEVNASLHEKFEVESTDSVKRFQATKPPK